MLDAAPAPDFGDVGRDDRNVCERASASGRRINVLRLRRSHQDAVDERKYGRPCAY